MSPGVNEKIATLLKATGANGCVECGKCVAVCPMVEMYPDFCWEMSPRGLIRRAATEEGILDDPMIWRCTQCNAGTDVCPEAVSCRDLVAGLRRLAAETGRAVPSQTCVLCAEPFVPQAVEAYLRQRLGGADDRYADTCPACRQQRYARRNS